VGHGSPPRHRVDRIERDGRTRDVESRAIQENEMRTTARVAVVLAMTALALTAPGHSAAELPAPAETPVVLHGTVIAVTGQALLVRADDGRTIFVNMAGMLPDATPFLAEGQRVAVLGSYGFSETVFVARDVQRTR
jgi:hypothetical protein